MSSDLIKPSEETNNIAFEYEPLVPSLSTTRLVVLYPPSSTSTHDTVRCSIENVNLDDNPKYAALSYLWGSHNLVVPIIANGKLLKVTQNLGNALRHLRHGKKAITIWVDLLSISQLDKNEKSTHILRMPRIFTQAAVVLSWLGTGEEDRDLALMKIFQMRESIELRPFGSVENGPDPSSGFQGLYESCLIDRDSIMKLPDEHATSSTEYHEASDRVALAIVNLLGLRYWKRVWVQQELLLAKTVIFVCGNHDIDEPTFKEASCLQHLEATTLRPEIQKRLFEAQSVQSWPLRLHDTLKELLFNATYRRQDSGAHLYEASDLRDNVYGLMGLAKDAGNLDLRPDYSNAKTWEAVCQDVTVAYLKSGDVDILSYAGLRRSQRDLPSWVIDWSADWKCRPGNSDGLARALYPLIHAASSVCVSGLYSATKGQKCRYTVCESEGSLEISGTELGTVSYVGKSPDRLTEPLVDIQALLRDWIQSSSNDLYGSDRKAKEAAIHSLVVDIGHSTMLSDSVFLTPSNLRWHPRCDLVSTFDMLMSDKHVDKNDLEPYEKTYRLFARQRSRFATKNGYIGLGPWDIEQGDVVCLLFGGSTPFVLRRSINETFKFMGDAYVHGIMDGELMHSNLQKRLFRVV